jgi:hypothetical protein
MQNECIPLNNTLFQYELLTRKRKYFIFIKNDNSNISSHSLFLERIGDRPHFFSAEKMGPVPNSFWWSCKGEFNLIK